LCRIVRGLAHIEVDLAKVDAHSIRPHEYKDSPELTEQVLSRAVVEFIKMRFMSTPPRGGGLFRYLRPA